MKRLKTELTLLTLAAATLTLAFGVGWAGSHLRLDTWGGWKEGGATVLRRVDHHNGYTIKSLCYSSWAGGQRSLVWLGW